MSFFEDLGLEELFKSKILKRFSKADEDYYYDDDELLYEDDEEYSPTYRPVNIIKIVLTGGPCSGKTTLIDFAAEELKKRNIPVFIVTETATELLKGNLVFADDPVAFQRAVYTVQLAKESATLEYAATYLSQKQLTNAVIIYDRSALDGRAYIDSVKWLTHVFIKDTVLDKMHDRMIIHLESAACVGKFSKENNEERYEDDESAVKLDKRLFDLYRTLPHFAHIPARDDFEQKKNEFRKVFMAYVDSKLIVDDKPE